ncbi:MAG TPA: cytochrome oxidase [Rhodanobacteraceae bacterium]|nr:cytochrome oxidase [Rhodanobacteraceae bacterium]
MNENQVWYVALAGMAVVALIFVYVIATARVRAAPIESHDDVVSSRHWVFIGLIILTAIVSYFTLRHFPFPAQRGPVAARQVVKVMGVQWAWQMSTQKVKEGVPVEFEVSSGDVNHDFAVYAPDGRIVGQVQAMPGYTNKMVLVFKHAGTYTVRCLEYCGLGHADMETTFTVVANPPTETAA